MDFFKTVAGKVISGVVALVVVAGGITWWQMDPSTRQMLITGTGRILAWFAIVLLVPWATFFLVGRIGRLESNLAGGTLVAAYTLAEVVLLAWLFEWSIPNAAAWTFLILGGLVAGVYNLFTCDWIAEKVG